MCMKPSPTGTEWFEFQNAHSHHNNLVQPAAGRTFNIYILHYKHTMDSTGPCGELAPQPATTYYYYYY
jgi:hypothetical protein